MKKNTIKCITPYEDINDLCVDLSQDLEDVLREKLLGVYLTGSLTGSVAKIFSGYERTYFGRV